MKKACYLFLPSFCIQGGSDSRNSAATRGNEVVYTRVMSVCLSSIKHGVTDLGSYQHQIQNIPIRHLCQHFHYSHFRLLSDA